MADLSGYTALTEIHGAQSAMNMVGRYLQLAEKALEGNAKLLERVGDLLLFVSEDPYEMLATAIKLARLGAMEPGFLLIHGGLHFGPVLENEGSYFGTAMNLTSRIAAQAGKGQILCSQDFISRIKGGTGYRFDGFREVKMKNILQPITLAELIIENSDAFTWKPIDPVCRMQVEQPGRFVHIHENKTIHFCSSECRDIFINSIHYQTT